MSDHIILSNCLINTLALLFLPVHIHGIFEKATILVVAPDATGN